MTTLDRDIAARVAELRQLAAETTAAVRQFQRELAEALRERRLRAAEPNAPGESRARPATLRRR